MTTEPVLKRGYVKWEDDDGTRHKVPLVEYNAIAELEGKDQIEGESAPARGPVETPEIKSPDEVEFDTPIEDPQLDESVESMPERDAEVAERSFNVDRNVP